MTFKHSGTVAGRFRHLRILSPLNEKTPKGEAQGYLQAILYLAPHTVASDKTVCPYSTPACRYGCLFTAGRGKTTRVFDARVRRTLQFQNEPEAFLLDLVTELAQLQKAADANGLRLAIRLNGTSDIRWEREALFGATIFEYFPRARFFDYTRIPAIHRKMPPNWRLTFSLADSYPGVAMDHLQAGRSVAAIVPAEEHETYCGKFSGGFYGIPVVDGEEHDLRFLDPPGALVLLKPKGRLRRRPWSAMVHPNLIPDLIEAGRQAP